MVRFDRIATVGMNLDPVLRTAGASSMRDIETLVRYSAFSADHPAVFHALRIAVEPRMASYYPHPGGVIVTVMHNHCGEEGDPGTGFRFLDDLSAVLPAFFPEFLFMLANGCSTLRIDSSLEFDSSWQGQIAETGVSAHEMLILRRDAARYLCREPGVTAPRDGGRP